MTDNNIRDANETANADKGENILHIAKNGADELQRIKRSLNSKKTWATRIMTQLNVRAKAFEDSAAKHNSEPKKTKTTNMRSDLLTSVAINAEYSVLQSSHDLICHCPRALLRES